MSDLNKNLTTLLQLPFGILLFFLGAVFLYMAVPQTQLAKEGIQYVWMGDTLGNPKDLRGQRTLEGFQTYMKSSKYQSGLARRREIIQSSSGTVALTCAERSESECHRSLILKDLANLKSSLYR